MTMITNILDAIGLAPTSVEASELYNTLDRPVVTCIIMHTQLLKACTLTRIPKLPV